MQSSKQINIKMTDEEIINLKELTDKIKGTKSQILRLSLEHFYQYYKKTGNII